MQSQRTDSTRCEQANIQWSRRARPARARLRARLIWRVSQAGSKTIEKAVVIGVTADPEPHDFVTFAEAYGAIRERDSNRVEGFDVVDFLELQTRMGRILLK